MGKVVSRAMRQPLVKAQQEQFAKMFPKYLIEGPWHISAKVFLPLSSIVLIAARLYLQQRPAHDILAEGHDPPFTPETTQRLRVFMATYGLAVLYYMKKTVGVYPLVSYTMQSWSLCTLRYLFGALAGDKQTAIGEFFHHIDEALRFPSLVQNAVTFFVWWGLLTPIISLVSLRKPRSLKAFWQWNCSPFLLTVHGINLPFAIFDHVINPRELILHDLWNGLFVAVSYLWFYLHVLDRNRLPLYIILSPRSKAATIAYSSILAAYCYVYHFFNSTTKDATSYLSQFQ